MALKVRPIVAPKRANGQICGEIYNIAVKMAEPSFRTLARFRPRHSLERRLNAIDTENTKDIQRKLSNIVLSNTKMWPEQLDYARVRFLSDG